MIRLLAAALLILSACGEAAPPEKKNPRIGVSGGGLSIDLSGSADIGVSGSF